MSNSNRIKVSPENFSKGMRRLLDKYGDEAYEIAMACSKKAARQTTSDLKSTAPVGATGSYAKGWSHKAQKDGVTAYNETVYNRTDYQLTHLLEKPHETGRGGSYPKYKDHTGIIERIEEKQTRLFFEEVLSKL